MKKILVPCDFSEPAKEAFKFAMQIAQKSNGRVYVLHIIDIAFMRGTPSITYSYAFNTNFIKELEQEAEEDYRRMYSENSVPEVHSTFTHRLGSIIQDMEKFCKEEDIDLIIMGTQGLGFAGWGTNTEKAVRYMKVPVLAVRKAPVQPIRNIVVPVAPHENIPEFYDRIQKLQAFYSATIHLIWINTPQIFKKDFDAKNDVQQYALKMKLRDYTANVRSDFSIEEGLFSFAREIKADMIALATHARKGLAHAVTGSIAEDVVNHAHIPIWTFSVS